LTRFLCAFWKRYKKLTIVEGYVYGEEGDIEYEQHGRMEGRMTERATFVKDWRSIPGDMHEGENRYKVRWRWRAVLHHC
jgi:hypothetical protein